MTTARVTSKGQITIPVDIRNELGLTAGDKVIFLVEGNSVRFLPLTKDISSLKGIITKSKNAVSIKDMKATIKSIGGEA
jgi:antitoxin PrlF